MPEGSRQYPQVRELTEEEVTAIREHAAGIRARYGMTPDEPFAKECGCCPAIPGMQWSDFDYLRFQGWLVEGL